MLRLNVVLMVILSLCIVNQSISHPGEGAKIAARALCTWGQPQGQGDGEINLETWVTFDFGTHNSGDEHVDAGHQVEALQNRSLHDMHGVEIFFIYFYDLGTFHGTIAPDHTIRFDPLPHIKTAEKCFQCYAYAHGKFRWGDTKIYTYPIKTESHRVCLSPLKCDSPQCWLASGAVGAAPEVNLEVFDELRLAVERDREDNPDITGAFNENGIIHTHEGDTSQEFDPDSGMISGVTDLIPAAPAAPRVKPVAVIWASLKK